MSSRIRIDLHTHTHYSPDSSAQLDEIIAAVRRRGLDAIAVTDHDRVEGAFRLRDRAPFTVVVGEEIRTTEGEIIGLFLEKLVPPHLTPEETIARIREQGGLVYVPHPFDRVRRRSALRGPALVRLLDQIDAVEVLNARVTLPWDNWRAERFARQHGLPRGAGSDAHLPRELGQAWVELPAFSGAKEFLSAMREGRAVGKLSSPLVHFATRWLKIRRRFRRQPARPQGA